MESMNVGLGSEWTLHLKGVSSGAKIDGISITKTGIRFSNDACVRMGWRVEDLIVIFRSGLSNAILFRKARSDEEIMNGRKLSSSERQRGRSLDISMKPGVLDLKIKRLPLTAIKFLDDGCVISCG